MQSLKFPGIIPEYLLMDFVTIIQDAISPDQAYAILGSPPPPADP